MEENTYFAGKGSIWPIRPSRKSGHQDRIGPIDVLSQQTLVELNECSIFFDSMLLEEPLSLSQSGLGTPFPVPL